MVVIFLYIIQNISELNSEKRIGIYLNAYE